MHCLYIWSTVLQPGPRPPQYSRKTGLPFASQNLRVKLRAETFPGSSAAAAAAVALTDTRSLQ